MIDDLFFTSNESFEKKKIIKDLFLADCVAGWKERGSALLL